MATPVRGSAEPDRTERIAPVAAEPAVGGGLKRLVGVPRVLAGALMLVLVVLISLEVTLRYFFNAPLDWIDEIAVLLFIWMSALGAAAAVPAGVHMAVQPLANRAGPRIKAVLSCCVLAAQVAFGGFLVITGIGYARSCASQVLPVTGISVSWEAAALPALGALVVVFTLAGQVPQVRRVAAMLTANRGRKTGSR